MSGKLLRAVAATGALAFVSEGALELAHHQHDHFSGAADYLIEAAFALGLLLTLAGLFALHLRQERDLRALGTWSFRVAVCGQGALGVVAFATLVRGQDALGPVFPIAVLAWVLGTIGYAVAMLRACALPRWLAFVLAGGTVVGILVNPGGAIVLGGLWLTVATQVLGDRYELRPAVL
jgi:hypothetical protein